MVKIIKVPNSGLRHKSEQVKEINQQVKDAVKDLIEVTKEVDSYLNFWLGMAAPQIGINKQIFILRTNYHVYDVFVNPKIISKKLPTPAISKCYSVNGVYFPMRYFFITVKYQNLEGRDETKHFLGGKAWVVQHEIDHLNGVLASDYLGISF